MKEMTLFILGAKDPEMVAIEKILSNLGYMYIFPRNMNNEVIKPSEAYNYEIDLTIYKDFTKFVFVENKPKNINQYHLYDIVFIDHHNPGDPGYGKPGSEYMDASSIGQLAKLLDIELTEEEKMIACCDHSLHYAYNGSSFDRNKVIDFRLKLKAEYEKKSYYEVITKFNDTLIKFKTVIPVININGFDVYDTRGYDFDSLPYANEVLAYLNIDNMMYYNDKLKKLGVFGTKDFINYFKNIYSKEIGLTRVYGDPERGFAGGYTE